MTELWQHFLGKGGLGLVSLHCVSFHSNEKRLHLMINSHSYLSAGWAARRDMV